jgi:hypothetical protein
MTGLSVGILAKAHYLLGDGVPIGSYMLFRGSDRVGPLQFRGTEEDGVWRVYITLASTEQNGSVSEEAVTRQMQVLPDALSAFEPLQSVPVALYCDDEDSPMVCSEGVQASS